MRISEASFVGAAAILGLAACTPDGDDGPGAPEAQDSPRAETTLIECALHGAGSFVRECAVERVEQAGTAVLLVRHPDGGFRRFEVLAEQRGLAPADGAEQAQMEWREGGLGLAVGADRYRFPATLVGDAAE